MRQYLKNEVFKVSKWVELFISAIIMIAVIGGTIYLVKDVVINDELPNIQRYLQICRRSV